MTKMASIFIPSLFLIGVGYIHAQNTKLNQIPSPVLIELFTSQSCSSCPTAEELLNTWGMDLFKAKKALPLAFHVDYWDYLGWKDTFSSSFATDRQKQYASFYHAESIFTPEMVVNGQIGFNGADQKTAQTEVDQASTSSLLPPLEIKAKIYSKNIKVVLSTPFKVTLQGQTLYVTVFENDLPTTVNRGENSGKRLVQNFVVRSQTVLNKIGKVSIPIDSQWNISHLGVAAWIQNPQTMRAQGLNWIFPVSN
ncbi:MAG TPA: DUF1223 domain-containing protein [bacterium]|nr:DUF1223 domain-containing protein [bacterium]